MGETNSSHTAERLPQFLLFLPRNFSYSRKQPEPIGKTLKHCKHTHLWLSRNNVPTQPLQGLTWGRPLFAPGRRLGNPADWLSRASLDRTGKPGLKGPYQPHPGAPTLRPWPPLGQPNLLAGPGLPGPHW